LAHGPLQILGAAADTPLVQQAVHARQDIHDDHPRAFSEWRAIDELILTALAHTRAPIENMAERLGRTPAEIESQLDRLGLG
jgi:hypothetical protein